jgi:histidinol-phosphate aminotransferase
MKIKKALLEMNSETYADDNPQFPEGAVDCTQGCNPYGNHPALLEVAKNVTMNMIYSYPHNQEIYDEIINFWKPYVPVERHNIVIAEGSMGVLNEIAEIFEEEGARALSVAPTFTDATMGYKARGIEYRYVPLNPERDYLIDADALIAEMDEKDSIVYLDNPNNPTGQVLPIEDVERIVAAGKEKDIAVVVDEAYADFIPPEESAVCLLDKYENMIAVRTFSKAFGMAGMRAGYLITGKFICDCITKMNDPYNMNELARAMGAEALRHGNFALSHMDDFVKSKQMLRAACGNKIKMSVTDDRVPIVLLWHVDPDFKLADRLLEEGVVTVCAAEFDCLGANAVRIRVPRIEQMDKVCAAVAKLNEG